MFPLKDNIPTRRFPIVTVLLIVANVVMFFGFQGAFSSSEAAANRNTVEYGAIPYELTHPGKHCEQAGGRLACEGQGGVSGKADPQPPTWLTVLTAMFMHGGLLHIAGNMLFLWIFGNNIEDSMGRLRFVLFYLLGGVAALGVQALADPGSAVPTIGASGAVAAVLGAYALLYPRARVVTLLFIIIFFTIIELPALLVLGGWFILQAVNGAANLTQPVDGGGGVAYFAHIGGFLFGLIAIKLFADRVHEDYERAHRAPVY
ncbi:MAG: rhomboid family intramembrane serine protease [Thermoleophilaceae bacterium]